MTARTDIAPPLARIAIAIADYLIPLTEAQRDDVIVRALCVVEDGSPAADRPIPYVPTERHPVTACDDVPEPSTPMRPTPQRVAQTRAAATDAIEAAARSIVEVLSDHPEGLTKGALAVALNFERTNGRFLAALHDVVHSGRVRAQGNTTSRRYFTAGK
jgi:hypothetical protein